MGKGLINSAFGIYKRYYLRSLLLEVLGKNKPLTLEGIDERLRLEVKKIDEMYHSITIPEIVIEYEYLKKIECFKFVENETKITLSNVGIKLLQECVFEGLSCSAFLGYKALSIAKLTAIIAGVSLLVSLFSAVVSLCR